MSISNQRWNALDQLAVDTRTAQLVERRKNPRLKAQHARAKATHTLDHCTIEKHSHKLFQMALKDYGQRELPGTQQNGKLSDLWHAFAPAWFTDDDPWCSAAMNGWAMRCGLETSHNSTNPDGTINGGLNARGWLNVGLKVPIEDAMPGDVAVLWRGSPTSWKGHVALWTAIDQPAGKVILYGGNQGNTAQMSAYDLNRILEIRRLRKARL